jgi:DNA-binding NarL/FixJ family response regulator
MGDEASLNSLVGLLYDAVLDDAQWPRALQAISDFTGGTGVGQVIANPVLGTITHCETLNFAPGFNDLYVGYYAAKEVRLAPAVKFGVGVVMTENMLIEPRALKGSEIYNDLLLPFDAPHFMFAWLQKSATKVQTIAIEGALSHGAFDEAAVSRFALVMPHLIRAVRMRDQFIAVRDSQRAYREAMETLPFGVVVLDEDGHVVETTRMADEILRKQQGLIRRQRRVHATWIEDDEHLQQAMRNAIASNLRTPAQAAAVTVRRNQSASALKITLLPISSPDRFSMVARPSALLCIVDPDQTPKPAAALIQATLGFTQAEAALAHALFSGVSLREAAHDLGRSINTCKAQLKSIYTKTGCKSHVDLAKILIMAALGGRVT